MNIDTQAPITFDGRNLSIEDVIAVASRARKPELGQSAVFRQRITRGADFLDRLLQQDGQIYGVTTGYGDSGTVEIPPELLHELPHHLFTYHGVGTGRWLTPEETRAVLVARLTSLCRGASGVSWGLLIQLESLLAHDILPLIPAEGSVGASGDLTPLSYVVAAMCGEREVVFEGNRCSAKYALDSVGISPLRLRPKEALALMNGTSVMTALACLAFGRAARISRLATRVTACNVWAIDGNPQHFDKTLFSFKPHIGSQLVAQRLRQDLNCEDCHTNDRYIQDRYSLRCSPHVIGAMEDAFPWLRQLIEVELNSANDNPLIDPDAELVLHGGHFYGGHIALAMDTLKNVVANIADLLDRQLALLVDSRYSRGLPANLSAASGSRKTINHGLKALQISVSAWTAEALKQTMPASVFSRSTECHNQDKVSMGTIAAREAIRIIELTEQVVAAMLIASRQALYLRSQMSATAIPPALSRFLNTLSNAIPLVDEDRALDADLNRLLSEIRANLWDFQYET